MTTATTQPSTEPTGTHIGPGSLGIGAIAVIAFLVLVGKLKRPTPAKTAVALPGGATVTITQTTPTTTPTLPAVVIAVDDGADPMGAFATSWENVKTRYTKMKDQLASATATASGLRNDLQAMTAERDALQAKLDAAPQLDSADLTALEELTGKKAAPTNDTKPADPAAGPTVIADN